MQRSFSQWRSSAYHLKLIRGFVIASAPINSAIAGLSAPPIPVIQNAARNYDGRYGDIIDLSQAVPGYAPPALLLDHLSEAAGRPELLGYGNIEGEDALRSAYAKDLGRSYGARFDSAEVHITSGCNQAFVAAALTVAGPGEKLLLITPFYFNHETTLAMLGIGVEKVAATAGNGFLPDPDALAAAITPEVKALVCITPNNPTGAVYPPELMERLFDLCVERGIWLMVDETYRDFLPEDQAVPHRLFQRTNWRDHLIGLYSFSKSFCIPGHRLGAITADAQIVANVAKVMDNLQICAPRAAQVAVAQAMPELTDWRSANRVEIARRRATLEAVIARLPSWQIETIGAYFSYIRHPFEDAGSSEVAQLLAEKHGVLCLPGAFFGDGQDAFLRLAFANANCSDLEKLAARLP